MSGMAVLDPSLQPLESARSATEYVLEGQHGQFLARGVFWIRGDDIHRAPTFTTEGLGTLKKLLNSPKYGRFRPIYAHPVCVEGDQRTVGERMPFDVLIADF